MMCRTNGRPTSPQPQEVLSPATAGHQVLSKCHGLNMVSLTLVSEQP